MPTQLEPHSRFPTEVDAWHAKERIWKLYEEHGTVDAVVDIVKIPKIHVARVIANMPLRQVYRRKGKPESYGRKHIIECLKAAAVICGEPLTIPAYRVEQSKRGWPADLTVIQAFPEHTWEAACKAAGIKANPSLGPQRNAYTRDDCIAALRICVAEMGEVPSYERYVKWARANQQPSGPTVRVKVGPWRQALTEAFG